MPCWAVPRHQDIIAESPSYLGVTDAVLKCCLRSAEILGCSEKSHRRNVSTLSAMLGFDSGYKFMRQSTEAAGRISHISYVKGGFGS